MKISNLSYRVPSPQYRSTFNATSDVYNTKSDKCYADRSNIMSLNNMLFTAYLVIIIRLRKTD